VGSFGWLGEQRFEDFLSLAPAQFCRFHDAGKDGYVLRSRSAACPGRDFAEDHERSQGTLRAPRAARSARRPVPGARCPARWLVGGPPRGTKAMASLCSGAPGRNRLRKVPALAELQEIRADSVVEVVEVVEAGPVGVQLRDLKSGGPAQESLLFWKEAPGGSIGRLHRRESLRDFTGGAQAMREAALPPAQLDGIVGGGGVGDELGRRGFHRGDAWETGAWKEFRVSLSLCQSHRSHRHATGRL